MHHIHRFSIPISKISSFSLSLEIKDYSSESKQLRIQILVLFGDIRNILNSILLSLEFDFT